MSVFNDQRYYFVQATTIFVCLQSRFVGDFKMLVSYWLVDSLDYFKVESKSYAYFKKYILDMKIVVAKSG